MGVDKLPPTCYYRAMNQEIDPYEDYHGPATPKGFCPLCLSPERKGGMRAGSSIPFECGTSATVTGMRKNDVKDTEDYTDYWVYYRNPWKISIGDKCFRNIVKARDFFEHGT